jgi:hypothetical protein
VVQADLITFTESGRIGQEVCNFELWEATGEKPVALQIKERKWRWIGHTLRKNGE